MSQNAHMARGWLQFHRNEIPRQAGLDHHGQTKHHAPGSSVPVLVRGPAPIDAAARASLALDELERLKRSIA